ncbi:copper amine oxidase [Halobacillus sp. Marseille-Q1614]|uniref:copper amine oxidase n=1 Tax=Halobacillus sp. Marseille-Q1614 TaxID=2709134 RepID=UPI0015700B61|nr:copper amine oxidase [Halobacillus sp. Marseille-Q1614]
MKTVKKAILMLMAVLLLIPSFALAHDHEEPKVNTPGADLRASLDQLLSEHFHLAVTAMMKDYNEAEDAEQAYAALDQNAKDMTPAIESIYGEEGAGQFEEIFINHNDYSPDFVEAVKNDDEEMRKQAEAEVDEFVSEFSEFLAAATKGNLPQEAAAEVLAAHEKDVINVFDHYVNEESEEAYGAYREGFHRMFDISKALAAAITTQMPDKFENTKADTQAADLRSDLNSLAAEHFALATLEMQKGYDQAADYDFVTWAEDMNTKDFKAAIASIYGDEGAEQFEKLWQEDHIYAQSDIVTAALEENEEARKDAEQRLQKFAEDFGAFLDSVTEGNLLAEDAKEAIWKHESQVIDGFDHYAAGDYDLAYDTFRTGYGFVFGIGETLSDAIVKQMPDQFAQEAMPEEMPKTGLGGMADKASSTAWMWAAFAAATLVTGGFMLRKQV